MYYRIVKMMPFFYINNEFAPVITKIIETILKFSSGVVYCIFEYIDFNLYVFQDRQTSTIHNVRRSVVRPPIIIFWNVTVMDLQ